jgi:hypothetical protein
MILEIENNMTKETFDYMKIDKKEGKHTILKPILEIDEDDADIVMKAFNSFFIKLALIKSKRKFTKKDNDIMENDILHGLRQVRQFDIHKLYERMKPYRNITYDPEKLIKDIDDVLNEGSKQNRKRDRDKAQ